MTPALKRQRIGTTLTALAAGLWLGVALSPGLAAETKSVKQQLLELTGNHRAKVVWNQDGKIKLFDTKEGSVQELPFAGGNQPLLTSDGRRVLSTTGTAADRKLMMYDTETKQFTTVTTGADSNLLTIWRDPKSKRDWVYVNDCGSDGRSWDAPCGKIHRFPLDKPEAKELFWDRTTSHFYLMFSADGTRACFEPNWGNIGELKVAQDSQGKIDQDKSTFKSLGGGCFPGMAPDNSYRVFRLEGDHREIAMCDADGANPRKINVVEMPGVGDKGRNTWLTRWSTDPRYITLHAPAGDDARIWVGRFDAKFTKVEAWVPVVADQTKCMQSHAWIEPGK